MLFYVYPLKYVMNVAFRWIAPQPHLEPPETAAQAARLFVVYGLGYMAVFVILALLYRRAWTKRNDLELSAVQAFDAHVYMGAHLLSAAVGLASVLWALFAPVKVAPAAGLLYFLMAPVQTFYGMSSGKRRREFLKKQHTASAV